MQSILKKIYIYIAKLSALKKLFFTLKRKQTITETLLTNLS